MYQFLLFPRLTMLMACPMQLFDAETINNSSIKDNSISAEIHQPYRTLDCATKCSTVAAIIRYVLTGSFLAISCYDLLVCAKRRRWAFRTMFAGAQFNCA
jgi:hypothetical protein